VIEGGGAPRRELPRGLVRGAKVLLGVVAVVWLGAVLVDQLQGTPSAEAPRLSVVGEPVPSYQAGHGQFGVNLRNDSQTSVVIDYAAILDDSNPPGSQLLAPGWAAAKVLPISAIPGQFSHDPVSRGVEIGGGGGSAVLEVTVDPPCANAEPPSSAHVVVGWHTSSGRTGETALPDVLSGGRTSLTAMTQAACDRLRRLKVRYEPVGALSAGDRYTPTAIGARFSIRVPTSGWERFGNVSINKSTVRPGSAEAIIYWTTMGEGLGDGLGVEPCGQWWGDPPGSVEDYLASAASVGGIRVVSGPASVTLDGQPAQHLVFTVGRHFSCDPGFFFTWPTVRTGPSWTRTNVGDTVRIWLVDVQGTRLYFEAETRKDAGPDIDREIEQIMQSLRFA